MFYATNNLEICPHLILFGPEKPLLLDPTDAFTFNLLHSTEPMNNGNVFMDWRTVLAAAATVLVGILGSTGFVQRVSAHPLDDPGEARSQETPHVVFLINEDPYNYEAHRTVPPFADMLEREHGYEVTVLEGKGELPALEFPDLNVIADADLLVIFFRRAALPHEQMEAIQNYLEAGNPLVGVRTANHAFSVRENEKIPEGYESWWNFVPDILGARNRGYGPSEKGTRVSVVEGAANHPILSGINSEQWLSEGNVYHTAPLLDEEAHALLTGTIEGAEEPIEPIAWTRMAGDSKVFYTSLGYPADFDTPQFRTLLVNAIDWAVEK
jgi:type 1 glutamine amidotransferase